MVKRLCLEKKRKIKRELQLVTLLNQKGSTGEEELRPVAATDGKKTDSEMEVEEIYHFRKENKSLCNMLSQRMFNMWISSLI